MRHFDQQGDVGALEQVVLEEVEIAPQDRDVRGRNPVVPHLDVVLPRDRPLLLVE